MANFDSNNWYQIYVNQNKDQSLWGTSLFKDSERGAVYFNGTDTGEPMNRWQLYSINSTTYVLRSEEGGPTAFLSSKYARNETTPGQTAALMLRGDLTDDSVYWSVTPWGDGTFFMTNGANGTAWHLQKKGNGWVALNSNTTDTPPGQRWSFTAIHDGDKAAKINDKNYSTVDLQSATATAPATESETSGSGTGGPNDSSSSGGLSTGAKAGIGVGVGGAALIALIVFGLFFWRRRRQQRPYSNPYAAQDVRHEMPHESGTVKYEMYQENAAKHEMPSLQEQPPVELPNTAVNPNAR